MAASDSTAIKKISDRSAYHKAYERANKAKLKARRAAYYEANKEKYRVRAAAYYQQNRESFRERSLRWIKDNPERSREWYEQYYIDHKARYRQRERIAYAKNPEKHKEKKAAQRAKDLERTKGYVYAWRSKNPDALAHNNALRRTRKMQAQPAWANLDAIKAFYREAARLRKDTGQAWHVDHEIPLKHPLVSGLHVHQNLRVIPAIENHSKHNKFSV